MSVADNLETLLRTDSAELYRTADRIRRETYGTDVYIRGLIEITNHCKNNCYYCGIRRGNVKLPRYRLAPEEILECCRTGYVLGFRTFVMQGGEDAYYSDEILCGLISEIKGEYPDCAVTLSLGERSRESYKALFGAGADRYLLRHETADDAHYRRLHPESMSLEKRKECLWNLKEIGYQVGTGFMAGSPYQTIGCISSDIQFLSELQPDMIGIGPYITHSDTPFAEHSSGSLELTLRLVAIARILFPNALIPATTALGTIAPDGREMGLKAGANVVMPNLTPPGYRERYSLYDNKLSAGVEAAEGLDELKRRVSGAGYQVVVGRGDSLQRKKR